MDKSRVSFFDSRKAVPIFHWGKKEGPKIEVELPIPKAESWLGFPHHLGCMGSAVSSPSVVRAEPDRPKVCTIFSTQDGLS